MDPTRNLQGIGLEELPDASSVFNDNQHMLSPRILGDEIIYEDENL
jgi:hypothetical protein